MDGPETTSATPPPTAPSDSAPSPPAKSDEDARYEARVIRAFIRDDRLVSIPARAKKRDVILRFLRDRCFPEDRPYPEAEVNQRLALWHRDAAALRRHMVETGLMTRAAGIYRLARTD